MFRNLIKRNSSNFFRITATNRGFPGFSSLPSQYRKFMPSTENTPIASLLSELKQAEHDREFYKLLSHQNQSDNYPLHQLGRAKENERRIREKLEGISKKYQKDIIDELNDNFSGLQKKVEEDIKTKQKTLESKQWTPVERFRLESELSGTQYFVNQGITGVLILNRLTIAEKIIQSAKTLGLTPYLVYQEIDKNTPAVKAVESIAPENCIPIKSYSNLDQMKKVILALDNKIAIHPGIGFHAESVELSRFCEKHNRVFFGPYSHAMEVLSNKAKAKELMQSLEIQIPKSYNGDNQDINHLLKEASDIGYPIMVKAKEGGGGGKLNRIVHTPQQLKDACTTLKTGVTLEQYISNTKHIEIQMLGHKIVGVRDCSLQLRFQKGLEKTVTDPKLLEKAISIGEKIAPTLQRLRYKGAGTIEFLVDEKGDWYFIEVNARLQVEHPLTNITAKVNLAEWSMRDRLGRSYQHDDLKNRILNQLPVRQIRLYAYGITTNFPEKGEVSFYGLKGQCTQLYLPEKSERGFIEVGIKEGTSIDYVGNTFDGQIGAIFGIGKTQEEADKNARKLLSELVIEIDGKPIPYLSFVAYTLESLSQKPKAPELTTSWQEIAAQFAVEKLEPPSLQQRKP